MARSAETLKSGWLASLAHEKRASPHTLRAYGDDVSRFLDFLLDHLGGAVDERTLSKLTPADIRAFVTLRRAEGLGARGVRARSVGDAQFFPLSRARGNSGKPCLARRARPAPAAHFAAAVERG